MGRARSTAQRLSRVVVDGLLCLCRAYLRVAYGRASFRVLQRLRATRNDICEEIFSTHYLQIYRVGGSGDVSEDGNLAGIGYMVS